MTQRHPHLLRGYPARGRSVCGWLVIGVVAACSRKSGTAPAPEDLLRRGDLIVAETTAAEFFEGRVLEVSPVNLRVQRSDTGEVRSVGRADVYRLGGAPRAVDSNGYAICAFREHYWEGCRVLRREGADVVAVDASNSPHHIPSVRVLVPTGLSAMNIQRRFEEAGRRQAFESAVFAAGMPRAVPGWTPAVHRLVLAERNGRWYGAQIVELDEDRIVLRWDGQKDLSDVPRGVVAPQPPACGMPARGDRALRRPPGHGAPWVPVQIIGADGSEVTIEDIERTRAVVDSRELCPLGEAKNPSGADAAAGSVAHGGRHSRRESRGFLP